MVRTPSTTSVRKTLREGGFDSDAIVAQSRGSITIGHVTEGRVALEDQERTDNAMELASKLLGWGGYSTGWGGWVLEHNYRPNPLVMANID